MINMNDNKTMNIRNTIKASLELKQRLLASDEIVLLIEKTAAVCIGSLRNGGKVHFCGNGGSAADAQHLAAELSGRYYYDRDPLNAEALHVNTSYLTAVANDYGFNEVYARLLKADGKNGDILIALSTSGNSKNIIEAIKTAKENGILTIGLSGESGGLMKDMCDILIRVPSTDTPRIQEAHIMIGHIICERIESEMFPK